MTRESEIKNEIWKIWEILILAKENFHYSYYLHKPKTKEELVYINKSKDLKFIRHILWRTTVIELSKLFSNRDRFNLNHFIKKLNRDGQFGGMGINEKTINEWKIQIADNKHTIEILLKHRDKVYAHSDPNKSEHTKQNITFEQTEKLIAFTESIIREIYETIFHSDIIMKTIIFDKDGFNMIKILADEHQRTMDEMRNNFRTNR